MGYSHPNLYRDRDTDAYANADDYAYSHGDRYIDDNANGGAYAGAADTGAGDEHADSPNVSYVDTFGYASGSHADTAADR